uniref:F-box domain-containing protein n=1 Tax=Steinernema glaseri TaxID=37863 RepID=A0A1I7YGZ4_9BILA
MPSVNRILSRCALPRPTNFRLQMDSLPAPIVEQIVSRLPCRLLKDSLEHLPEESLWHSMYDWAANARARLRVRVFLPEADGAAIFYKLEKDDADRKNWKSFSLDRFLKYPEEYVLESVYIVGQPARREFKRKNHFRLDLADNDTIPSSLQVLLSRPFTLGAHSTLRLSLLNSSYPHVPEVTRHIRREFQIFHVEDVFGYQLAIESILSDLNKSASLRKLTVTSADCGDNLSKLVRDLVFQPQIREVNINGDTIDFDLEFFRAIFRNWQSLQELRGRVTISVPSSISEYATIKSKGRRQLRKTAHFHFSFCDTHRYGFKQQRVNIQYT